jgi:fumarate hydratase class II
MIMGFIHIEQGPGSLRYLAMGGTAVGTGRSTYEGFAERFIAAVTVLLSTEQIRSNIS